MKGEIKFSHTCVVKNSGNKLFEIHSEIHSEIQGLFALNVTVYLWQFISEFRIKTIKYTRA